MATTKKVLKKEIDTGGDENAVLDCAWQRRIDTPSGERTVQPEVLTCPDKH
ncbi:MAG: hypothetical protein ACLFQK_05600 [Fibrobacterota bacterium]